jgi:hypothetical protein
MIGVFDAGGSYIEGAIRRDVVGELSSSYVVTNINSRASSYLIAPIVMKYIVA